MPPALADLPSPPLPQLAARSPDSHKGDYGRSLLIGGSRGMYGAIALAGLATLRGGAGWVRLAVPERCLDTVASFSPCLMTLGLTDDGLGRLSDACYPELEQAVGQADCVAVGPGMGQSAGLQHLLLRLLQGVDAPLVIDADGLNNLSQIPQWSEQRAGGWVLTPHPGEWARLSGRPASDRAAQAEAAVEFARQAQAVVVLKGQHTLVTDGATAVWNDTGTPAMATGGSGDVLTGLITALVCQGLAIRDAAHLAVHVHGLAAELAEQSLQSHVVLPTELIAFLPAAFHQLKSAEE